jgi:glucose-6-phosphate-specific signal transduction histidine kinase
MVSFCCLINYTAYLYADMCVVFMLSTKALPTLILMFLSCSIALIVSSVLSASYRSRATADPLMLLVTLPLSITKLKGIA